MEAAGLDSVPPIDVDADVVMEDANVSPADVPEDRRMTRRMRAVGGVLPPPPVAPPRAKKPKVVKVEQEDPEDVDDQAEGSQQPPVQPQPEKGE